MCVCDHWYLSEGTSDMALCSRVVPVRLPGRSKVRAPYRGLLMRS
jgi:hypothetical protein